jgi:hypothetical protein
LVKVTAADGKTIVFYSFDNLVSAKNHNISELLIYPNPTENVVNISGIEAGNRIIVYNAVGNVVHDSNAAKNIETVSLRNNPAGMYMIIIESDNKAIERFKVIKR